MNTFSNVKHITISVGRSSADVYEFVSNPLNLPLWAAGLSEASLQKQGDEWVTDSPMGRVKIKFVEKNLYGVVDHDVTLPSGELVHNPLRVVKNSEGSEVVFTLFQGPHMTESEFQSDSELVKKDLQKLKSILEK